MIIYHRYLFIFFLFKTKLFLNPLLLFTSRLFPLLSVPILLFHSHFLNLLMSCKSTYWQEYFYIWMVIAFQIHPYYCQYYHYWCYLFIHLYIYILVYLLIYLFIYLLNYLSIHFLLYLLFICLFIYSFIYFLLNM